VSRVGLAVRVGPSIPRHGFGAWAAIGILAALHLRDQTGEAQHVETSLLKTGVAWMPSLRRAILPMGPSPNRAVRATAQWRPTKPAATALVLLAAPNQGLFVSLPGGWRCRTD